MRFKLIAAVGFVLVCGFAAADSRSDVLSIKDQYARWESAYRANDVVGLLKILAADFEIVTDTGKRISRASYKSSLLSKRSGPSAYTIVPTKIAIRGNAARVWSLERSTEGGTKHTHTYLDIWVKRSGSWLMQRSTTLKEH